MASPEYPVKFSFHFSGLREKVHGSHSGFHSGVEKIHPLCTLKLFLVQRWLGKLRAFKNMFCMSLVKETFDGILTFSENEAKVSIKRPFHNNKNSKDVTDNDWSENAMATSKF